MTGKDENGAKISELASWLSKSHDTVVFTGAGISTESGMADFRSPGGIWDRYDPNELSYPRFVSREASRRYYWNFYREYWQEAGDVAPNSGHLALAELERLNIVTAVVTQNTDGLHKKAGHNPDKIYELHGNMWEVRCLECFDLYPWEEINKLLVEGKEVFKCRLCGGLLKTATISFGQSLSANTLQEAQRACSSCDILLCIGSSLVVYPAASLPEQAKRSGAKLVIINREPTHLDRMADMVLHGEAGDILSDVMKAIKQ